MDCCIFVCAHRSYSTLFYCHFVQRVSPSIHNRGKLFPSSKVCSGYMANFEAKWNLHCYIMLTSQLLVPTIFTPAFRVWSLTIWHLNRLGHSNPNTQPKKKVSKYGAKMMISSKLQLRSVKYVEHLHAGMQVSHAGLDAGTACRCAPSLAM